MLKQRQEKWGCLHSSMNPLPGERDLARGEVCEQGEQRGDDGCLGLATLQTNAHWKAGFWFPFPALPVGLHLAELWILYLALCKCWREVSCTRLFCLEASGT